MNFIVPCLNPQVSSNKPSADDYEVHNLVRGDKGFMGAYFIRPPLDITVKFPVPIDINLIKLGARLEQKCSTGFSIFTEPQDISGSEQHCDSRQALPNKAISSCSSNDSSPHSSLVPASTEDPTVSHGEPSEIYLCVGKFYTKGEDELLLQNHHYKHWMRLAMPNANVDTKNPRVFRGALRHSNRKALRCVKSVIIKIQSTAERGPPVLRFLEIWGQPGITTDKFERKRLLREWSSFTPLTQVEPAIPRLYNSEPEEKKNDNPVLEAIKNKDLLEIPEDFLDPLTCDLMTVPLLLPSGNSIDAHTLERFIANEATWGRPASDPFTGVPFRRNKQPVPNVPLKTRIDRFLLANTEHPDVSQCGRTVGSSLSSNEASSSTGVVSNKRLHESSERFDTSDHCHKRKAIRQEAENVASVESRNSEDSSDIESFDLSMEIEAALKDKPKYLPNVKHSDIQKKEKEGSTSKMSMSNVSQSGKIHSQVKGAQTLKNQRDLITRPSQCLPAPGSSLSGHHGIVQMIGGIISVAQGRTAGAKRLPTHHVNDRPTHLICGDKPQQNYTLPVISSASCSCGETEALYEMECGHLLCRRCLLGKMSNRAEVVCDTCQKTSKKSKISKYHSKSIFSS